MKFKPLGITAAAVLFLLFAMAASLHADVKLALATPFRDGAVLQRGKPVPVWGLAGAGEGVKVEFKGQVKQTVADAEGRWRITLDRLQASAEPASLTISATASPTLVVIKDVVVGEVWLCSGQSNMHFFVSQTRDAAREMAEAARYPLIRQFTVKSTMADEPKAMVDGVWEACSPEAVKGFTAVGYFFARDLHRDLKVPIGIIHATLGGSPIEGWMSAQALAANPAFAVVARRWEQMRPHVKGDSWRNQPSGLYNGLIYPLEPLALAGMLWYQGEGNCERAGEYSALFTTMISQWRGDFQQPDLPFLFVQLPNYEEKRPGLKDAWAQLREAQASALKLPHTGMAVTLDVGDAADLHPTNKQAVGHRLALVALAQVYGREVKHSGPVFRDALVEGAAMRVRFAHAAGGLAFKGDPAAAFEIAGAEGRYLPAQARIEGETVVVSAAGVEKPVSVRLDWTNNPTTVLVNDAGLPAAPFRSEGR